MPVYLPRIHALLTEYLSANRLMQLATSHENHPWICSVYFAFDEHLSLYFISKTFRRHSKELRINPRVAAAICAPPASPFEMPARGVQLEGEAIEVNELELADKYLSSYCTRFPAARKIYDSAGAITGNAIPRIYKITPSRIVLFDEEHYPAEPQQVVDLNL